MGHLGRRESLEYVAVMACSVTLGGLAAAGALRFARRAHDHGGSWQVYSGEALSTAGLMSLVADLIVGHERASAVGIGEDYAMSASTMSTLDNLVVWHANEQRGWLIALPRTSDPPLTHLKDLAVAEFANDSNAYISERAQKALMRVRTAKGSVANHKASIGELESIPPGLLIGLRKVHGGTINAVFFPERVGVGLFVSYNIDETLHDLYLSLDGRSYRLSPRGKPARGSFRVSIGFGQGRYSMIKLDVGLDNLVNVEFQ